VSFWRQQTKIWLILIGSVITLVACNETTENKVEPTTYESGSLLRAVQAQDVSTVEKILQQTEYDVNEVTDNKENSILLATQLNNFEIGRKLIDAGANVNMQDMIQDSAYLYASAQGRTEILRYMLTHAKPAPDQSITNRYGGNALIPAAEKGHLENVRLLLADGHVDINFQNNFGYTALIEAVALKDGSQLYQEIVKVLLDGGARKDLRDNTGKTALDYAHEKGYQEIVALLK